MDEKKPPLKLNCIKKFSGAGSASEEHLFRNVEVGVERGFAPFHPYFVCDMALGHCVTCKGSSYTKNEYNLFYHKLDGESLIFFYSTIFVKKNNIFRENHEKLFWGHI